MSDFPELSIHEWSALRAELVWAYDKPVRDVPDFVRDRRVRRGPGQWAWLLREGTLRLEHASGTHHVRAGSWVILPSGAARQSFSRDAHLLSIHFFHSWPSGESFVQNEQPLIFPAARRPELEVRGRGLASYVARCFPREHYRIQSAQKVGARAFAGLQVHFSAWIETWLAACLAEGASWSRSRGGDARVLSALGVLNGTPLEEPFPKARLLARTRLGEVHLNRLFLCAMGVTPVKYWKNRRLRAGQDFLAASPMPVKEISWRLGFRSDSHFATWFLANTGFRPSEYRLLESGASSG